MIRVCVMLLLTQPVMAGVHFGSKKSGLVVSGSATLDLGVAQSLQAGVVRNSGGTINAGVLDCTDMNFENTVQGETKSSLINGTLTMGADEGNAILLYDGDALIVAGETIELPVTAQSGASVITGYGGFDRDIVVNPGATVRLAWEGILNTNIAFMAGDGQPEALVVLEKDLYLGTGCDLSVHEAGPYDNKLNFNGHTLFLGGDEQPAMLRFFLACSRANIQLRGPVETFENFFVFLDGPAYLHGGGHVYWVNEYGIFSNEADILDEEGAATGLHYPVTFEDITFRNIWCGLFQGGEYWNFINTTCESGDLSITINGTLLGSSPSPLAGDTTFGGTTIDLNSDLTNSNGMWFFNENAFIEGDGHCIDASQWRFSIDTNKQLTLRNVVLKNFDSNSFAGDGTIRLSNVTFELDELVDLSTGPLLSIDGPVTFFTGPHTVTVRTGSSIVNATVLYDTSGTGDAENIIGFNDTDGRLKYVDLGFSSSVDVRITENAVMDQDEYLYPNINGALARTLTFAQ
ncbi:MAG: hypothetical protein WCJ17_03470, partial [bacterium]